MFSFTSKVRFSETDIREQLALPSIINYFQDCSEFHSQSVGSGAGSLGQYAWILNSWQIVINQYPKRNETIQICTKPHKFKGIEGYRNFLIQNEQGETLVYANSIWTYFDMEQMRPARITQDQFDCYTLEEPLDMEYAPRKISLKNVEDTDFTVAYKTTVQRSQLDMFGHMNNCQYVSIAYNCLPEDYALRQVRVEYKKSALLHDEIVVKYAVIEERILVLLTNAAGEIFAVVELIK